MIVSPDDKSCCGLPISYDLCVLYVWLSAIAGRLSSSGSDSEREVEDYYETMDTGIQGGAGQMQSFTVDENAQQFPTYMTGVASMQPQQFEDQGEDSFDPMQFFNSFKQGAEAQEDINRDLALSDSGSDSDHDNFQDVDNSELSNM